MRTLAWWKYRARRLLGRPQRVDFLRPASPGGVGAEVGAFRGEFSPYLLVALKPSELHLVDAWWTLYGSHYPDWGAYSDFGRLETRAAWAETLGRVSPWRDRVIVHVGMAVEVLRALPDRSFDWAYLDTSHEYEATVSELTVLRSKIRPGGWLFGDDWAEDPAHLHEGVARAVKEAVAEGAYEGLEVDPLFSQWRARVPTAG